MIFHIGTLPQLFYYFSIYSYSRARSKVAWFDLWRYLTTRVMGEEGKWLKYAMKLYHRIRCALHALGNPYMHRAVSGVDRLSMSEATQSTCLLCSVENRCSTLKETRTPSGLLTTQGSRTAHRPCLVECVGSQLSCLDRQQEYWLFL